MIYHGTSTSAGLSPGDTILPPESREKSVNVREDEMSDLVFLSPNKAYARIYAGRTSSKIGGDPILVVAIPSHPRQIVLVLPGAEMIASPAAYVVDIVRL